MKTTLIILTRNEIEGIRALFNAIPLDAVDECFAIDYRSSDGTTEFLKEKGIRVIAQEKAGRGEAFRMGIASATGDAVVFFSPDGNENPQDIPKLLSAIREGYDLAIASRFLPGSRNEESEQRLPLRAWANRAFTLLANLCFRGHLTDTINGFRAMRKQSFERLHLDAAGFAIEYQISIRAMKLRLRIKEIPTREGDRIGGQSTAHSIPTGLKVLRVLMREIWIGRRF
jgi:glycosyltransferase involved in cell wall biosynthesis